MLAAFHLNLTAVSCIALIVGLYLVYNTVSVTVLARRSEIGTLRAIGVTRGQVRRLFLGEAAILAIAGGAAGVVLGRVAADWTVALTSTTVSTLYIATAAAPPALGLRHVLLAALTSVPLSLAAAFVPAREASRVPPVAALRGVDRRDRAPASGTRQAIAGVALVALGAWLALLGPVRGLPIWGYASVIAIIAGASALVPVALHAAARLLDRPARTRRVEGWLAVTNVATSIPRLSISVGALAVSLAMMVAIAVMIGSFRETVAYWVTETLQADLFVAPGAGQRPDTDETLSPAVIAGIAASPDVAAIDRFRVIDVPYEGALVRVRASDFAVLAERGSLLFKSPADGRRAIREAIGADRVLVSESFALKHHAQVGGTIDVPASAGPARMIVAAVYYDYSSDRGVISMDRATFARLYGRQGVSGLSVYLKPGVPPEAARERLLAAMDAPERLAITTQPWLRAEVLRIFDSTFAITYALELVAIVVAMLGVAGTLLTLMLERQHELTTLRLMGATGRQLRLMIVTEAAIIGAVGQAIGLAVGLALSLVLIYVINVQSFGWTIQFHLPWAFLIQSTVLVVVATAVAGLYPARRASRLRLAGDE
jgi:putative ABC transport system permease protein